jgi:hypothetical protein
MKAPATKLPWRTANTNSGFFLAGATPGYFIEVRPTKSPEQVRQDAEYIAHACNAYPRLVGVIGALVADLDRLGFADPDASINGGDLVDLIAARMDDLREAAK